MAFGTVKWFNPTKGYGFISPQDGGKDVLVHITAVLAAGLKGLNEGQLVSYDVAMERGKAGAANLRLIGPAGFSKAASFEQAVQQREKLQGWADQKQVSLDSVLIGHDPSSSGATQPPASKSPS